MKITNIRILNYKGYSDSGRIPIGTQTTVVVGQNNAGKTAFLEALTEIKNKPYRSPPDEDYIIPLENPHSSIQLDLVASGKEVLREFLFAGNQISVSSPNSTPAAFTHALQEFFSREQFNWEVERRQSGWASRKGNSKELFGSGAHSFHLTISPSADKQSWSAQNVGMGTNDTLHTLIASIYEKSIFSFKAERLNIGTSPITSSAELAPDAANLPSALLQLRSSVRDRYVALVREVFPNILAVSARPIESGHAAIFVSNRDSENLEREAIELSLNDCGTGISQVLAMLYVVVTAEFSKVIIIDEPNSFLHPGAVRKLLSILKRFNHQYIVSTHSSDIINVLNPEVLALIFWEKNESNVEILDRDKAEGQRRVLEDLGVRLSDVFGADNILWVEGQTEELCFPLLLKEIGVLNPGTAIISLIATGDVEARGVRGDLALQVYERLSKRSALVPPALAISLDREDRTDMEIADIARRSNGLVKFLPCRSYENYLLDAEGIAWVLNQSLSESVQVADVQNWIAANKSNQKFYSNKGWALRSDDNWSALVDAGKFLGSLFFDLSGRTLEYRKTLHSPALTKWLLEKKRNQLGGLMTYLGGLVSH